VGSNRDSLCEIRSPAQIISLLHSIQDRNQLVTLALSDRTASFVTSVLNVNEAENVLAVDRAPNSVLNSKFAGAERVYFETTLDKIRIFFSSTCLAACLHEGRPALLLKVPDRLVRLQRREFYRIATPLVEPVRCVIPVPAELGYDHVTLTLVDISCGGLAILDEKKVLDETIGRQYDNCRITLPGAGTLITALQVRDCRDVVLPSGKRKRRLGLEFINLPAAALAAIQRYIMKLERTQNARMSGLR